MWLPSERRKRLHLAGQRQRGNSACLFRCRARPKGNISLTTLSRAVRNDDDGTDKDGGFLVKAENAKWCPVSDGRAVATLMSEGLSKNDAVAELGAIGEKPWYEVNEPFAEEFLPNRHWNMRGAKLRFAPVEPGPTPFWDRIFNHCGLGLDEAVAAHPWCQEHDILTGGDYLRTSVARLIRFPKEKLPYLFLVSEGKTVRKPGRAHWRGQLTCFWPAAASTRKWRLRKSSTCNSPGASSAPWKKQRSARTPI